jgi:hypothetical protein
MRIVTDQSDDAGAPPAECPSLLGRVVSAGRLGKARVYQHDR